MPSQWFKLAGFSGLLLLLLQFFSLSHSIFVHFRMSGEDGGSPALSPQAACPSPAPAAQSSAAGAAAFRKTPRQTLMDNTRRRYFESLRIDEPTEANEKAFQLVIAAALGVPVASKDGRFLGDELPLVFTRDGEMFALRKFPRSTLPAE